jgi:hypothetical protein
MHTDRTNLANASIAGMRTELKMNAPTPAVPDGNPIAYSIVTLVFFTTYVFFQPPATVLTKKIGPRVFLSAICGLWGCVMLSMGFVKKWQQLAALRVILGIFEAGFFPVSTFDCKKHPAEYVRLQEASRLCSGAEVHYNYRSFQMRCCCIYLGKANHWPLTLGLRLSPKHLVLPLRDGQAECFLLPHRNDGVSSGRNSCFRLDANGRTSGLYGMELDCEFPCFNSRLFTNK